MEEETSQPEQCFYASFKIYLSDSRKNSVCESEDTESLLSGTGEVVRIETYEISDINNDDASEEDKTLSLTNEDDLKDATDDENDDVLETDCVEDNPKIKISQIDRSFKRSLSESDDCSSELRCSRGHQRHGSNRHLYDQTQSVERAGGGRVEKSSVEQSPPVFYLDPLDWIRSEGSTPLPLKEKSPSKLLENFPGVVRNNLDILTESEDNLNSEIEAINNNILLHNSEQRSLDQQRNSSLPNFRLETPTIELTREESVATPDQGYSSSVSFRSVTPAREKTRRTTFPLLCSRPGSACDKMMRKKSCISAEDIHFLQSQSRETPTQGGSISGFVRKNSKNEKLSDFGEEHIQNSMSSLFQIG